MRLSATPYAPRARSARVSGAMAQSDQIGNSRVGAGHRAQRSVAERAAMRSDLRHRALFARARATRSWSHPGRRRRPTRRRPDEHLREACASVELDSYTQPAPPEKGVERKAAGSSISTVCSADRGSAGRVLAVGPLAKRQRRSRSDRAGGPILGVTAGPGATLGLFRVLERPQKLGRGCAISRSASES